jgi:hypothetical protein
MQSCVVSKDWRIYSRRHANIDVDIAFVDNDAPGCKLYFQTQPFYFLSQIVLIWQAVRLACSLDELLDIHHHAAFCVFTMPRIENSNQVVEYRVVKHPGFIAGFKEGGREENPK